jgi:N-acetylated-alpha-linked acidic dipeptidase
MGDPDMRSHLAALLLIAALVPGSTPAEPSLLGFGPDRAAEERTLESRFDALLDPDLLREWMRRLSARPHHLGSAYGRENAEFIAGLFRSWGYDTRIEEFHVLFPTPRTRRLELVSPEHFLAALAEPPLPEDSTSGQSDEQLPTFNAYSIDGDVTAPLVYVNYGVPKDYEELDRRGIDVRGKIVLARYGGSWRGTKPKVAAERGAVGCIIYSDPREDGYFEGDVYPKGGYRSESSAQRGSVADMPLYCGDPLTPGVGATRNPKKFDLAKAKTLTRIPVLPIGYSDALPLLRALAGPMAPEAWRGALPLPYHLGPGPATVHLQLAFDWKLVPALDVIATLRGSELPDEWIVRGNHHDAWVNGGTDPVSGLVALLEEARAVGELAKRGWRPRRTLMYAAWDGEEEGLIGSTEWAETHADVLRDKAAVYINSDSNARGLLEVAGSHTLEAFIGEVARDVVDPEKKISVLERARAAAILNGSAEERKEMRARTDLPIRALGSGSDYTPFLQHLGIAALNLGYGGEDEYGQYHSIYDTFDHYLRFMDPTFVYGITQAKTTGRAVLRLAGADVLPFEFTRASDTFGRYVKEVVKLADDMRDESVEKNRRIEEGTFTAYFDPTKTFVVPAPDDPVPYINFAPLQNAVAAVEKSAQAYEKAAGGNATLPLATQFELDRALMGCNRALTRAGGLPGRPWYVHHVYAPGRYTGYGVKTLPGVREALELRRWQEAEQQVTVAAQVLDAFAAAIDRATALRTAGAKP